MNDYLHRSRALIAEDVEELIESAIDVFWDAEDATLRHHFRVAFLGVRPSALDFLVNAALILHNAKAPEV
jgi:hypothetical protein